MLFSFLFYSFHIYAGIIPHSVTYEVSPAGVAGKIGEEVRFGVPGAAEIKSGGLVAKAGIEPATHGFSVRCSTN